LRRNTKPPEAITICIPSQPAAFSLRSASKKATEQTQWRAAPPTISRMFRALVVTLALVTVTGCARQKRDLSALVLPRTGLVESFYLQTIRSRVVPPEGWTRQPLRESANHIEETWLSPSGSTAYGIIHFNLPFPVGAELALWGFLREMRKKEGEANLLSKEPDSDLPGIRFVAEGGPYKVRVNLITAGWEGWAIYAGTFRNQPENQMELDLAVRAREYTAPGKEPLGPAEKSGTKRTATGNRPF
jgi:hypothetical protein